MENEPSPTPAEAHKPKLTRYLLVEANTGQQLVDKVAEFTQRGYVPAGGVCVLYESGAEHYAQAMFLPKRRTHPLLKFWRGLGKLIREILEFDNGMGSP